MNLLNVLSKLKSILMGAFVPCHTTAAVYI